MCRSVQALDNNQQALASTGALRAINDSQMVGSRSANKEQGRTIFRGNREKRTSRWYMLVIPYLIKLDIIWSCR